MARFLLIVAVLIGLSPEISARERIIIATGLRYPLVYNETQPGFLDTLVTEAYKRIGIDLKIIILPAARVLINANKGIEDGCLLRIKGLERKFPNLVRVPEKLMVSDFVAYSGDAIDNRPGIKKYYAYPISYITGWAIFEQLFESHPDVTKVKTADQMFVLLQKKRVDVVLYERWQGLGIMRDLHIKGVHLVNPPLVSLDMFMYLNKKHAHLVDKIAASLAEMKKDGTYDKFFQTYLTSLLK